MTYQHVLFDLDGTVIESDEGIIKSAEYAMERMGKSSPGREELKRFIGPPILESFETVCHLSPDEARQATGFYRERYGEVGIFECTLYDGIQPLVEQLSADGCGVHLATAKPTVYAKQILAHFQLDSFFRSVQGVPLAVGHYEKADIVRRVLDEQDIASATAVMVGDRHYDILGARACNVDGIGVLYGYGSEEELTKAGARFLAKDASEIKHILYA